jgi:predicted helicase
MKIYKDYSKRIDDLDVAGYELFKHIESEGIMFCAQKHREGSDIAKLDGCIFLDGVSKRSSKTFVQCIGRVLRKDKNGLKKYGLIIDCKVKSVIECCNRISNFLSSKSVINRCTHSI